MNLLLKIRNQISQAVLFLAIVCVLVLAMPWSILLAIVGPLYIGASRSDGLFAKASRRVLLALTIGLAVCCLELMVFRITDWTYGIHQFEIGLLHLHFRLKWVEEFFSLKNTALVLLLLFSLEVFLEIGKLTSRFIKIKDGLYLVFLTVSVAFSFSCFSQEPLREHAFEDNREINFAHNLVLRDWYEASAEVVAARELTDAFSSPGFEVRDVHAILGWYNQVSGREIPTILWLESPTIPRLMKFSSITAYSAMSKAGLEVDAPHRPTTKEQLLDKVEEMPDLLPEPRTWQERENQLRRIESLKAKAANARKIRNSLVESLISLLTDKLGELGEQIAPDELGALPRVVGELVSDFADVFCDKVVARWLEKDENLTSDELIVRSEAGKAQLRAAPMFVKSMRSELLSVNTQKAITNMRMARALGQEEEHSIDWRDLESRNVRELATIRAKAKDVIKKEIEVKEGKRGGERGEIK